MLYTLSHDSSYQPDWARSLYYEPDKDPGYSSCNTCGHRGQRVPLGPITLYVDPGDKYPDIMACGGNLPLLIVSRRVVDCWQATGVTGFEAFPTKIVAIDSVGVIEGASPPDYVYIHINGRGVLDREKTPVKQCSACGDVVYDSNFKVIGYNLKESSWNGFDLFATEEFPMVKLCTERVLELARTNQHTNMRFTPAEQAGSFGLGESIRP